MAAQYCSMGTFLPELALFRSLAERSSAHLAAESPRPPPAQPISAGCFWMTRRLAVKIAATAARLRLCRGGALRRELCNSFCFALRAILKAAVQKRVPSLVLQRRGSSGSAQQSRRRPSPALLRALRSLYDEII